MTVAYTRLRRGYEAQLAPSAVSNFFFLICELVSDKSEMKFIILPKQKFGEGASSTKKDIRTICQGIDRNIKYREEKNRMTFGPHLCLT